MPRHEWGTNIQIKDNIATVLVREIARKKPGIVGLSTVTDPYQPIEHVYKITRHCLESFLDSEFPVHIQTKSALVVRDRDVISKLKDAQVMMTIATLHDHERKLLEPGASPIPDRLTSLKTLTDAGITTTVFLGPLYPTTTTDDLTRLFDAFRLLDVTEVWVDKLNAKPGIANELASRLTGLPDVNTAFQQALLPQPAYFPPLRQHMLACGKDHGITVVDAF
jgi:DNA repair photolyase